MKIIYSLPISLFIRAFVIYVNSSFSNPSEAEQGEPSSGSKEHDTLLRAQHHLPIPDEKRGGQLDWRKEPAVDCLWRHRGTT